MNAKADTQRTSEILRQRAVALATPLEEEGGQRLQFGVFTVGSQALAVPMQHFRQVFVVQKLTGIPCAPPTFLGVCMAGGHIVTLVNTGEYFQLRSMVAADIRNGVVIGDKDRAIAFGAHELLGIEEVEKSTLRPFAHASPCITHTFNARLVVDPARIFDDIIQHKEA